MSFLKIRYPKKRDLIVDDFRDEKRTANIILYRNVSKTSVHN